MITNASITTVVNQVQDEVEDATNADAKNKGYAVIPNCTAPGYSQSTLKDPNVAIEIKQPMVELYDVILDPDFPDKESLDPDSIETINTKQKQLIQGAIEGPSPIELSNRDKLLIELTIKETILHIMTNLQAHLNISIPSHTIEAPYSHTGTITVAGVV